MVYDSYEPMYAHVCTEIIEIICIAYVNTCLKNKNLEDMQEGMRMQSKKI